METRDLVLGDLNFISGTMQVAASAEGQRHECAGGSPRMETVGSTGSEEHSALRFVQFSVQRFPPPDKVRALRGQEAPDSYLPPRVRGRALRIVGTQYRCVECVLSGGPPAT